jgi:hypothetical protein
MRLTANQSPLGLVLVSLLVLARQAAWLLKADRLGAGSLLLGMNGLLLGTVGGLMAPRTRGVLVEPEGTETETENVRAEVEALIGEIRQTYRQFPVPPPPLTTWQLIRDAVLRPAWAFRELTRRPHLELCWMIPVLVGLWPRLTVYAPPSEKAIDLLQLGFDYGLWLVLYDLGKAAMFWGVVRVLGLPLRYASALAAFILIDIPSLTSYLVDCLWGNQYVWIDGILYSKLGLGPLVAGLAQTYPSLFEVLAKVTLLHVWTFCLWWVAIAPLMGLGAWVALLLSLVTFPCAHIFAAAANLVIIYVVW